MKKIICMTLALVLCIGLLVGCGAKEAAEEAGEDISTAVSQTGAEVGQLNTGGSSTMGSQATPPPEEAKFQDHLTVLIKPHGKKTGRIPADAADDEKTEDDVSAAFP